MAHKRGGSYFSSVSQGPRAVNAPVGSPSAGGGGVAGDIGDILNSFLGGFLPNIERYRDEETAARGEERRAKLAEATKAREEGLDVESQWRQIAGMDPSLFPNYEKAAYSGLRSPELKGLTQKAEKTQVTREGTATQEKHRAEDKAERVRIHAEDVARQQSNRAEDRALHARERVEDKALENQRYWERHPETGEKQLRQRAVDWLVGAAGHEMPLDAEMQLTWNNLITQAAALMRQGKKPKYLPGIGGTGEPGKIIEDIPYQERVSGPGQFGSLPGMMTPAPEGPPPGIAPQQGQQSTWWERIFGGGVGDPQQGQKDWKVQRLD